MVVKRIPMLASLLCGHRARICSVMSFQMILWDEWLFSVPNQAPCWVTQRWTVCVCVWRMGGGGQGVGSVWMEVEWQLGSLIWRYSFLHVGCGSAMLTSFQSSKEPCCLPCQGHSCFFPLLELSLTNACLLIPEHPSVQPFRALT